MHTLYFHLEHTVCNTNYYLKFAHLASTGFPSHPREGKSVIKCFQEAGKMLTINWSMMGQLGLGYYQSNGDHLYCLPQNCQSNWAVIVPPVTPNPSFQHQNRKSKIQNMSLFCTPFSFSFCTFSPLFLNFCTFSSLPLPTSCSVAPFSRAAQSRLSKYFHSSSTYLFDQVSNLT